MGRIFADFSSLQLLIMPPKAVFFTNNSIKKDGKFGKLNEISYIINRLWKRSINTKKRSTSTGTMVTTWGARQHIIMIPSRISTIIAFLVLLKDKSDYMQIKNQYNSKENIIKNIYLFPIILFFIGCQGRETDQNYHDSAQAFSSVVSESIENLLVLEEINIVKEKDELSNYVKEKIEKYGLIAPELDHSYERKLAAQINGNFTGSGNREIIAFYEEIQSPYITSSIDFIEAAFCFVLDSDCENIEKIYYINWIGIGELDAEQIKPKELGREIIWRNKIIGRVGDFNKNGYDELYLSVMTTHGTAINIFEFNEIEFVDILNENWAGGNAIIINVDHEKKCIDVQIDNLSGDTPSMIIRKNSYIWNVENHLYELLLSDFKEVRWNSDTQQYNEIE